MGEEKRRQLLLAHSPSLLAVVNRAFYGFVLRLWAIPPMYAGLTVLVVGGGLVPFSVLTNLHFITDATADPVREVGFLSAFNWWVVDAILLPIFTLTLFGFQRSVRRLFRRLGRQGMLVNKAAEPVTDAALQTAWDHMLVRVAMVSLPFGLCVLLISLREWYLACFVPVYVLGDLDTMQRLLDQPLDWTTAALFIDGVSPTANILFTLWAYLVQTLAISLLSHIAIFSIALGLFLDNHSRARAVVRIVPNTSAHDSKMGLQAFRGVVDHLLLWTVIVYSIMLLVRLWQQYLRSGFTSGFEYLRQEWVHELWPASLNELPSSVAALFYLGAPESYNQTGALVAGMMAGIISIGYALFMIQRTISRGRRLMVGSPWNKISSSSADGPAPLQQGAFPIEHLSNWPLQHPTRAQIGALLLFYVLALTFYRLVFVLLLIVVGVYLKQLVGIITGYLDRGVSRAPDP